MSETRSVRPQIALEMTMRDVLGNMEEMVGEFAFRDMGGEFAILAIEAPEQHPAPSHDSRTPRCRDILSAETRPLPPPATQVA